nr:MAG TPA: hypothetical protein [Caudoviricetes sp.]
MSIVFFLPISLHLLICCKDKHFFCYSQIFGNIIVTKLQHIYCIPTCNVIS